MFDLGKQKIQHDCPKCGRKITFNVNQVSRQEVVKCHSCNTEIQLNDKGGSTRKSVRDINKSFKDLERTLKRFGK